MDIKIRDYVEHPQRGIGKVIEVSPKEESKYVVALFKYHVAALVRKDDLKIVEPDGVVL